MSGNQRFLFTGIKIYSLLFLLLLSIPALPQKKKIYIANDDHTDYMWTGDEQQYKSAFSEMLDYYIRINDSTAGLPYNQQSKWNCDGSYWVYNYKLTRSPEQFNKLLKQIREGKITVPLNSMIVLLGAAPAEATLRDMYYAGSLKRKYGLDLSLVLNMEDQVLPLGLSSLWAGAGARYSWKGVCACATKVSGLERDRNQMFWYKGLDDQKILMKWYSVNPSMITNRKEYRYNLGDYLEASNQLNAVTDCKALMNNPIYPYSIAAAFGKGGDDLKTLTDNFTKVAREKSDSNVEVIVSNEIDFFKDFEQHYGDKLPSQTISYGSTEWGNSFASLAEVSATVKRSVEKLRAAEAMYAMVALKDSGFAVNLSQAKEKAWLACGMYFEHDWTADGPHITRKQRADWQKKTALIFTSYVDTLYNQSLKRLGQLIKKEQTGRQTFFVFNPLSWERSDYCDFMYNGGASIKVLDRSNGKEVPFQQITKKGIPTLRILASAVPSMGYKVFEIVKTTAPTHFTSSLLTTDSTIENNFYKIRFTRQGVITGLIDKKNNRECIRQFEKFFCNDLGSGAGEDGDSIRLESNGAVSATMVAFSYKPLKHTTKITLFSSSDRIEIENYISQNLDAKPVTYSFSFNLDKPDTWHEEAGAILHAKTITKGGNYADTANRVDWLAINHFTDIGDSTHGFILSNRDAYFMKTGNSTSTILDDSTAHVKILAAAQVDNGLGLINQDGDSYFEDYFAIKPYTRKFNAAASMRFALEHQNPFIAGVVTGGNQYDPTGYSLITISDPDVMVWAAKPAEEGIQNGLIVRMWNLSDINKKVFVGAPVGFTKAAATTHIETGDKAVPVKDGILQTEVGHNKMQTYRLFFEKK